MTSDEIYQGLTQLFSARGFNLIRLVRAEDYDRKAQEKRRISNLLPGANSLILVGFTGKDFWEVLQTFLEENREFKNTREHWVDDYTLFSFESARQILENEKVNYRTSFPFDHTDYTLDFSKLGELGGVGVKSLLGILINPEYGSWISLRGAIITDLEFKAYDKPLDYFNPCPPCPKPCISACPASTISENSGWDYHACMRFRITTDTCNDNCTSRRACPYGKEHQYSEDQLAYHHRFVLRSIKSHFQKT